MDDLTGNTLSVGDVVNGTTVPINERTLVGGNLINQFIEVNLDGMEYLTGENTPNGITIDPVTGNFLVSPTSGRNLFPQVARFPGLSGNDQEAGYLTVVDTM